MQGPEGIPGRASPEGTRRFAARFARPGHFRSPDRLALSSIGMGTRSGDAGGADDLAYRSSAARALELGCNVFDTAIFYRMQTSERALGAALGRAIAQGRAARDEIFVISKCGYLSVDPSHPLSQRGTRRYLIETYLDTGLVDAERIVNGVHTLGASFVRDQIRRSRRNLGLQTLDLYCIEEPELQLLGLGPDAFRELLREVFGALEAAVADGEIAAYGVSSWSGLLVPYTEKGHLSIVELFDAALEIGGADHHLRALQLPCSLGLGDALVSDSQFGPTGAPTAVLETLRDTGTAIFVCAPLVRGRAVGRLPDFVRQAFPELGRDAQHCLQFARSAPGVTSALVGMRELDHVEENLAVARHAPAPERVIAELLARAEA